MDYTKPGGASMARSPVDCDDHRAATAAAVAMVGLVDAILNRGDAGSPANGAVIGPAPDTNGAVIGPAPDTRFPVSADATR